MINNFTIVYIKLFEYNYIMSDLLDILRGLTKLAENTIDNIISDINDNFSDKNVNDYEASLKEVDDFIKNDTFKEDAKYNFNTKNFKKRGSDLDLLKKDFKVLNIEPTYYIETVKKAYRTLIKEYHPDKYASKKEEYELALKITTIITSSYNNIIENLKQRKNQ